jgi:hypothetical protein
MNVVRIRAAMSVIALGSARSPIGSASSGGPPLSDEDAVIITEAITRLGVSLVFALGDQGSSPVYEAACAPTVRVT